MAERPDGKIITISKDVLRGINILAVMAGTDPKNYIQDLVTNHVKEERAAGNIPE